MRKAWWIGIAAAGLLLTGSFVAVATMPPTYELWANGRYVMASSDLAQLHTALKMERRRMLDRPVTMEAGEYAWTYRLSDLGFQVREEQLLPAVREAMGKVRWWQRLPGARPALRLSLVGEWDQQRLAEAVAPIQEKLERAPVPAELAIEDRRPVITPEVPGVTVAVDTVLRSLQTLGESDRLQVPLTPKQPAVTKASLEELQINRLIAEWSTDYDPAIPRAENVERAAAAFDGLMLRPGEILSYNGTVGPVTAETGWKEAFVIENGKLVPGIGGGVCQVATTFYGAALRANLEIMERHPHMLAVWYIDPSQDAAIAQGYQDLKLRNSLPGHILIKTEASGGTVTFRIYGDAPEGQEVRIESRVTGTTPFETQYMTDAHLAPGQRVVVQNGGRGLTSEAYRVLYQNGVEIKRELLSRDSYLPAAHVIAVGP